MNKKQDRSVAAFEGTVEQGRIRLRDNVRLPENTRVFVVVPDLGVERVAQVATPRLADKRQASDFKLEVSEAPADAGL
ncbi:MAG: hypothetical protein HY721_03845 [Planctomycetes bacterium]|nr:hypothetical protein [Planctomycetota bacterium]